MKLCEAYQIVDGLAPKSISDEYCLTYGAYDNSGVLIDVGEEIKSAVFSLDLSVAAIEKAVQSGANLIVTHHPAIYGKISDIRASDFEPLDKKLVTVLRGGISVISMHLNLDCAQGGIDESLMQGVCLASGADEQKDVALMHALSVGGYGRAYAIKPTTLQVLTENIKTVFSTERLEVYGDKNKTISRVASFCGGGADEAAVEFAVKQKADAILSSDFKHHVITLAIESGLSVIALTHYASENYGFEKFYQKIRQRMGIPCIFHTDDVLL